jgi:uncharacterized C2H2 Zn-finger protein
MVQYTCERCAKIFSHRGDYKKHLNIKKPCSGGENAPDVSELLRRLDQLEEKVVAIVAGSETVEEITESLGTLEISEKPETPMEHPISKAKFMEAGHVELDGIDYTEYTDYLSRCMENDDFCEEYGPEITNKWRRKENFERLFAKYRVYDIIGNNQKKNPSIKDYSIMLDKFITAIYDPEDATEATEVIPEAIVRVDTDGTISRFTTMISRMEQALYNIGVVGTSARDALIPILILRLLQKHIESGTIDVMNIDKYEYDDDFITKDTTKYVLLKSYLNLDSSSAANYLRNAWMYMLAVHPTTKKIFEVNKYVDIQHDRILLNIVQEFARFDFESCAQDNLSTAYQHFIHRQFKGESGSKMGQHFTPDRLINMMMREYSQYIPKTGKYIDPFMGTAGFVMGMYRAVQGTRDGNPSDYLHGTELDPNVYKYAFANLLVQTGQVCENIGNANAFKNHKQKYSAIFTNPPFGGTVSAEEKSATKTYNLAKVANRNLVCLQYCMHLLAPGGICSMVWVNGAECFGSSKSAVEVRKRLFTEFQFLGAIMVPGQKKVFEHA